MQIHNKPKSLLFLTFMFLILSSFIFSGKAHADDNLSEGGIEEKKMIKIDLVVSNIKDVKSEEGVFYVEGRVLNLNELGFQKNSSLKYYFKFTKEELGIYMPKDGKVLETFKETLVLTTFVPEDSILFVGNEEDFINSNENPLGLKSAFIFDISAYQLYFESIEDLGIKPNQKGVDLNVTLGSMRILEDNNEYYMYDFEDAFDNNTNNPLSINRVVYQNRRVIDTKHPHGENLVGKRIRAWGVISTSDNKTLEIRKWLILDTEFESPATETFGPEMTIYGYMKHERGFDVYYKDEPSFKNEFYDFNGKKYTIIFADKKISRWKTEIPLKITGTLMLSTEYENVIFYNSHEELEKDFEYRDSEMVSFKGVLGDKISEQLSDSARTGHVLYEFIYEEKNYVAIFDTSLVGVKRYEEISQLKGEILLSGIVSTKSNIRYLTVLDYSFISDSTKSEFESLGNFDGTSDVKQKTFEGNVLQYESSFVIGKTNYLVYSFLTKEGKVIYVASKESEQFGLYSGSTILINTTFNKDLFDINTFVLDSVSKGQNLFEKKRGTIVSLIESGTTTCTVNLRTVDGSIVKTMLPKQDSCETTVGLYVEIFGKENISTDFGYLYLASYYKVLTTENGILDIKGEKSVTFNGYIKKIVRTTETSVIVLATNQYGYQEYLEIDLTYYEGFLEKLDVSESYLFKTELSFTGYRMETGIVFVSNFGFIEIPKEYPKAIEYKFDILDRFPNMNRWEGVLDISDIGGQENQLMLITASDKYILYADIDTRLLIEKNIKKRVCLRGEYREGGKPYWSGQIVVYDFQTNCSTEIQPEPENIPQLRPDPQKEAHYTYQYHADPKEFVYGNAILEALYFPEVIETKDSPPVDYKK